MQSENRGRQGPPGDDGHGRDMEVAARGLAADMLADIDHLGVTQAERVLEGVPVMPHLPDAVREDVHRRTVELTRHLLTAMAQGGSFEAMGAEVESAARRRFGLGAPMEQSLRGYELGARGLTSEARLRLDGNPDGIAVLDAFARRLMEWQRLVSVRVAAGYGVAPDSDGTRDEEMERLLSAMIRGEEPAGGLEEAVFRLGVLTPLQQASVSVPLVSFDAGTDRFVARLRRSNPGTVVGFFGHRVVVLSVGEPRSLPTPRGHARIGADGIAGAIRRAGNAADVAARLGRESLDITEAAPLAALLAMPDDVRGAFVSSVFGDLVSTTKGTRLLETVAAVLSLGSTAAAVKALHVHRHTLDYRMSRFREATGLDVTDPATRLQCEIALFLLGLLPVKDN